MCDLMQNDSWKGVVAIEAVTRFELLQDIFSVLVWLQTRLVGLFLESLNYSREKGIGTQEDGFRFE